MLLKTRVDALYTQEKIACDMGKLAKTEEKKYYKEKSIKIREEIENLTVCQWTTHHLKVVGFLAEFL